MFERFTPEARGAVVRALDVARALGSDRVEPVHLLLAVATGGGRAGTVLRQAGIDADRAYTSARAADDAALAAIGVDVTAIRRRAEDAFGSGVLDPRAPRGRPALSGAAKRSLREARVERALGRRRLDDGSVLLGVLAVGDPAVRVVLADQGVDPLDVRRRLVARGAA